MAQEEKPGIETQEIAAKESRVLNAAGFTTVSGVFGGENGQQGWTLSTGSGVRYTDYFIRFKISFKTAPQLTIGGNVLLDIDKRANARLTCDVLEVFPDGFRVRISTWADSIIWAASYSWIAIGNV